MSLSTFCETQKIIYKTKTSLKGLLTKGQCGYIITWESSKNALFTNDFQEG